MPKGKINEKESVALKSISGAVLLTSLKVIVGLASGSLGILAEAAHSALDLISSFIAYMAVRISSTPADKEHPYGHGKVENLSALAETLLLLITCGWIVWESVHRLMVTKVVIDASIWTFLVMAVSIVVDASRSKMLFAAAKKYNSQALEADAIHFSTDIWSSAVVILGLIFVKIADFFPALGFLHKADAVAALIVAAIVVGISMRLGGHTIQALMDGTPVDLIEKIHKAVHGIDGILGCHAVRVRQSGPQYFADLHIALADNLSIKETHDMIEKVEAKVREIVPGVDVTVRPEPRGKKIL